MPCSDVSRVVTAAIVLAAQVAGIRQDVGAGTCDFDIHYNRWVPTFKPTEYEHNGKLAGIHCLEACCKDPSCAGLALESSLASQCYKYSGIPAELANAERQLQNAAAKGDSGVPLATFLAGERVPEWSVIVKRMPPNVSAPAAQLLSASLKSAVALRPRHQPTLASKESALDKQLRRSLAGEQPANCQWKVHYDTWRGNFASGEYSHDDGGVREECLKRCCADPTCTGLQMESTENFQCYKYNRPPVNLAAHSALDLGDGAWLRHKPQKWSVFVKELTKPIRVPLPGRTPPDAATAAAGVLPSGGGGVLHWIVLVLTVAALVAIVMDNIAGAASFARRAGRMLDKLGLNSGRGESEQLLLQAGIHGSRKSPFSL